MAASMYGYRRGLFVGVHPEQNYGDNEIKSSSVYLSIDVDRNFSALKLGKKKRQWLL